MFSCFREGNDPDDYSRLTYRKLLEEVCRFANVLKSKGVTKGDRVAIYMPMILELPIAMLACTRIGAVHSVVVKNFSVYPRETMRFQIVIEPETISFYIMQFPVDLQRTKLLLTIWFVNSYNALCQHWRIITIQKVKNGSCRLLKL